MSLDYQLHVFRYPALESIIEKAVDFFAKTPVHNLPPPERFSGPGVYGLYYIGDFELYGPLAQSNRGKYNKPIYIGKAVPPGARTARLRTSLSASLAGRFNEVKFMF